jgi:hypothetical protein
VRMRASGWISAQRMGQASANDISRFEYFLRSASRWNGVELVPDAGGAGGGYARRVAAPDMTGVISPPLPDRLAWRPILRSGCPLRLAARGGARGRRLARETGGTEFP